MRVRLGLIREVMESLAPQVGAEQSLFERSTISTISRRGYPVQENLCLLP